MYMYGRFVQIGFFETGMHKKGNCVPMPLKPGQSPQIKITAFAEKTPVLF